MADVPTLESALALAKKVDQSNAAPAGFNTLRNPAEGQ
jgi:hypothetical protein